MIQADLQNHHQMITYLQVSLIANEMTSILIEWIFLSLQHSLLIFQLFEELLSFAKSLRAYYFCKSWLELVIYSKFIANLHYTDELIIILMI